MSNLIDHPTLNGCCLFTGVAFGINKYLPALVDKDVTLSIVTVLKSQVCSNDDGIVAYFCFPMLGISVPLRPGDALIFNLNEPNGLSSCCNSSIVDLLHPPILKYQVSASNILALDVGLYFVDLGTDCLGLAGAVGCIYDGHFALLA